MKVIDMINKIAKGEDIPNFIVDDIEYYMGANGYLKEFMGDDVEWYMDKDWLNKEIDIIIDNDKIKKVYTELINSAWDRKQEEQLIDNFNRFEIAINKLIDRVEKLEEKYESEE